MTVLTTLYYMVESMLLVSGVCFTVVFIYVVHKNGWNGSGCI